MSTTSFNTISHASMLRRPEAVVVLGRGGDNFLTLGGGAFQPSLLSCPLLRTILLSRGLRCNEEKKSIYLVYQKADWVKSKITSLVF